MRFLAIDLEACNKYIRGSVFSIGVVEADENFNITYKEDIIINPHCKFNTNFRKPIHFSVTEDEVKKAPSLAEVYPKLEKLFEGDVVIMAHSANNDMFMLNEATRRAKLPPFKFRYICTQMIYSAVYDVMTGIGLDKAAEQLNLTFNHHKADDDAEMCLHLLKSCCDTMGCDYSELELKLGIVRGYNRNYGYDSMTCHELDVLRKMHKDQLKDKQKKLTEEIKTTNGESFVVDPRGFELVKTGKGIVVFGALDSKSSKFKLGQELYLTKRSAHKDLLKVKIDKITTYKDLLTFYHTIDRRLIGAKSETEIDFLTRVYPSIDETKKSYRGVCVLEVKAI